MTRTLNWTAVLAALVAAEPATILMMPSKLFAPLIQHPSVNRRLMAMLCACCRSAWHQVGLLNSPTAESRVRAALHQIALERGTNTEDGISISMRLTHREIADYVGISRETATRIVNDLQTKEILLVRAQHFVIPQLASLFPSH